MDLQTIVFLLFVGFLLIYVFIIAYIVTELFKKLASKKRKEKFFLALVEV